MKYFLIFLLTLSQILLYFLKISDHLVKKDVLTFVKTFFISAYFWKYLYMLLFGSIIHNGIASQLTSL